MRLSRFVSYESPGYEQEETIPVHRISLDYISVPPTDNKPPFDLPQHWIDKKSNLNWPRSLFRFRPDIIGGNSGSPG